MRAEAVTWATGPRAMTAAVTAAVTAVVIEVARRAVAVATVAGKL